MPNLLRPEPVDARRAQSIDERAHPQKGAALLLQGKLLQVTDRYSTGVRILTELRSQLPAPPFSAPYAERMAHRETLHDAERRLLVPFRAHKLALAESPTVHFFKELYGPTEEGWLPLGAVQELLRAWNVYKEGVPLAVLGHSLHPFYGTYVPTRTTHLELFATWLSSYDGPRDRAIDVGTGSGVLAFMLAKAGFDKVLATDDNPNAVESVRRQLKGFDPVPPITPQHTHLLGQGRAPVDLIVFNPPWTHGKVNGLLDRALYYEDGMFESFFDAAHLRLTPTGRVAILFSDLIRLVQPDVPHPIEAELARGRFELAGKLRRKVRGSVGRDGRKRATKERVEVWELRIR